jgi:hypothetical protein
MMGDLSVAIRWAAMAHDGQTDKAGQPYILHPLRVMLAQTTANARVAAVLHDVVEDSALFGLGDILGHFGTDVHEAVDALTRREGEDYFAYIGRCYDNPIARQVKIADLNDNMDTRRVPPGLLEHDARLRKYDRALLILTDQTVVAA